MNEDVSDDDIKHLEDEIKKLEESEGSSYGAPSPPEKDNLFKFFREILNLPDTTRVGNLDTHEIGSTKLGVRHYQDIAAYADEEGWNKVANYLRHKGEIITSTSMSKKGFWAQLFVTQIKKEQKLKEPDKIKKSWWGGGKQQETSGE